MEHFGFKWWTHALDMGINGIKIAKGVACFKNEVKEGFFAGGAKEIDAAKRGNAYTDATILLTAVGWAAKQAKLDKVHEAIEYTISAMQAAQVGDTFNR